MPSKPKPQRPSPGAGKSLAKQADNGKADEAAIVRTPGYRNEDGSMLREPGPPRPGFTPPSPESMNDWVGPEGPAPDPLALFMNSHQRLMDLLFGPKIPSVPGSAPQAQAQVAYGMDNTRGDGVNMGGAPADPQIMQQLFGR